MRLAPTATLLSISAAVAAFACSAGQPPASASAGQDATDPSADSSSAPAPAAAPAPVAPAPAPVVDLDAGLPEAGTVIPLPVPTGTIPIPGTIPPFGTTPNIACLPTSIPETEPNNDLTTPNMISAVTSTFCGHVDPGDVDVVSFVMPANVREFGFGLDAANGFLNLQPFAAGQPFSFQGNYPFEPGQVYSIQISSGDGQPIDYRLSFTFL